MKLSELEKLSIKELKNAKNNIDFVLSKRNGESKENTDDYLLYKTISASIFNRIKRVQLEFHVKKRKDKHVYNNLLKVREFLDSYLKEIVNERITKNMQKEWYILYSEIICNNIMKKKRKLTFTNVLGDYEMFPELLDEEFPDYIKYGLIKMIFER